MGAAVLDRLALWRAFVLDRLALWRAFVLDRLACALQRRGTAALQGDVVLSTVACHTAH